MKFSRFLIVALSFVATSSAFSDDSKNREVGLTKRVPWNTSRIIGSPDPPAPYRVERVFSKLKFKQPVDITNLPGSDRLFVVEVKGKL